MYLAKAEGDSAVIRVAVISPEPTPYRAPLFDLIAREPGLDVTVFYAAQTVADREWEIDLGHHATFLPASRLRLPLRRLLRHDYPLTPSIWTRLDRGRFDCIVVSGWSTFAAQTAIAWARRRQVPYLITSESHLLDDRPRWIAAFKRLVIPHIVGAASGILVTGSRAAEAAVAYGASPERVRVFANTIDVDAFGRRVAELRRSRDAIRSRLGLGQSELAVLSVARLVHDKGLDLLIDAVAAAAIPARLVVAGTGPRERQLRKRAEVAGVEASWLGYREGDQLAEAYAAADVFALLSRREPWGVVVNEAAAAGLPLILSDRVGAAYDLLRSGENGELIANGDTTAAAYALRRLVDPELRQRWGERSRELVASWGYERSVASFRELVSRALSA